MDYIAFPDPDPNPALPRLAVTELLALDRLLFLNYEYRGYRIRIRSQLLLHGYGIPRVAGSGPGTPPVGSGNPDPVPRADPDPPRFG